MKYEACVNYSLIFDSQGWGLPSLSTANDGQSLISDAEEEV